MSRLAFHWFRRNMLELDARKMMRTAAAVSMSPVPAASGPKTPAASEKSGLSPLAIDVAAEPIAPAWSPIVVAGTVRMIELALTVLVGLLIYVGYVVPSEGFEWHYAGAILGIAVTAMAAFQIADIYQIQAFRGYEKQYFRLASAWSVVFLVAIGATFFAKIGDHFSRVWLGGFYVVGLVALLAFRRSLFLLLRQWTRQGRLRPPTV